jgi:hypothetical protein
VIIRLPVITTPATADNNFLALFMFASFKFDN